MARDRPLKYLLDTNVLSELRSLGRAHPAVRKWALQIDPKDCSTSVLVFAEIRRGIELKRRKDRVQAGVFDRWFASLQKEYGPRLLPVDEAVANAWVDLNVPDRMQPIDSLIAATAKVHGLALVTRNARDFTRSTVTVIDPFAG